jgi:hypothetical protein
VFKGLYCWCSWCCRYTPEVGDVIVGRVTEVRAIAHSNWGVGRGRGTTVGMCVCVCVCVCVCSVQDCQVAPQWLPYTMLTPGALSCCHSKTLEEPHTPAECLGGIKACNHNVTCKPVMMTVR